MRRLLFVEDNRAFSIALRIVMKSRTDFQADFVECGPAALSWLNNQNSVDNLIVVADLGLPGMNGHTLVKAIRASDKLHKIPIVILSGSENPEDKAAALAEGASTFYVKPDSSAALDLMLDQIADWWKLYFRVN